MGTMSSIAVPPDEVARLGADIVVAALADARSELERMDQRFSHYQADSDINRWQSGGGIDPDGLADILHVLDECDRMLADSGGVFVARNPRTGSLDTAGYVKGYAIRRSAEVLAKAGLAAYSVGVGGDGYFAGRPGSGRPWHVAIQHPHKRFGVAAVVPVVDGAVATSGTAERGDHIWHGEDAGTRHSLASFTVIGPDIAEADCYATIGFAMGEAGIDWVAGHQGYRTLVVRRDGSVVSDAALVSAA